MLCYHKITRLCSFNLDGGGTAGKGGVKITGATININSKAPKAPSDGSGDGGSKRNGRWGYEPYYSK